MAKFTLFSNNKAEVREKINTNLIYDNSNNFSLFLLSIFYDCFLVCKTAGESSSSQQQDEDDEISPPLFVRIQTIDLQSLDFQTNIGSTAKFRHVSHFFGVWNIKEIFIVYYAYF